MGTRFANYSEVQAIDSDATAVPKTFVWMKKGVLRKVTSGGSDHKPLTGQVVVGSHAQASNFFSERS